jgi:hypothetical protein
MILSLLLTTLLLPSTPQESGDQVVRLRDGRMLVGAIVEHNLDGFRLTTARDGGHFTLVWSDLFPGEADRLRDSFGYRNQTEVPMTTAHRVLLQNGRELIGRILRQDSANLELRVRDTTTIIPLRQLAAPPEGVVVEAASILTPAQFYAEQVPQVDSQNADAQFEFAQELEVMFALEEARVHFLLCSDLAAAAGDTALVKRVAGAIAKLDDVIANQEEAEFLETVKQLMHRERFSEAAELMATYEQRFAKAALRGEFLEIEGRFDARRDAAVTRYLQRHWYNRVLKILQRKALDKNLRIDEASAWLETELPSMVRLQLISELESMDKGLTAIAVNERWQARLASGASSHSAGYGDGTWILGVERAKAGLHDAEAKAQEDGKSEEQRDMEERMKKYMDNLEAGRRAKASAEEDISPEDWWLRAEVTWRFQWLLAYYAEFSGDYEIVNVQFKLCSTCAGQGFLESLNVVSKDGTKKRTKCPTCHAVQVRRGIVFK